MECYYCASKGHLVCPECMNEYMKNKKKEKEEQEVKWESLYTTDVYSLLNHIVGLQDILTEKEEQVNYLQERLSESQQVSECVR